jgi:hypothetical protein
MDSPTVSEAPDRVGFPLPPHVAAVVRAAPAVQVVESREELIELACGGPGCDLFEVGYDTPGRGWVLEATVARCRNGAAVNYLDAYMRRRDPDSMVVADDAPSDKPRFEDRFGVPFARARQDILDWLSGQELILVPFRSGHADHGYDSLFIGPANAGFFAGGLADLQGYVAGSQTGPDFRPRAFIYLAPPFRHTLCDGQQVVVHDRSDDLHEIFSLNLYPGPSAKKGVYGILLNIGENEGWVTNHASTVQVVTPYDNTFTIMHEGASGGGKSEMLEYPHRTDDGRLRLGRNVVSGEERHLALSQTCQLHPVTDDMAQSHPHLQNPGDKLVTMDAENAWFVRVDHITGYGTDPHLERICAAPEKPLIFINVQGVPRATALIWEHTEDAPGTPCPNPRVILPRDEVPNVQDEPVEVDIRTLGIRTPPCTREHPSYGIIGMLHILPPALGWLWRLAAPRGHANPSIVDTAGLQSEGVGSFWPFATGRVVDFANILLRQIRETPETDFAIFPNSHIGAWNVGFMPQWIGREYLARRGGARFRRGQLRRANTPLLGYELLQMHVEGANIPDFFLDVSLQPEVGDEAYQQGAEQLKAFFRRELEPLRRDPQLDPLGKRIIEVFYDGGSQGQFKNVWEAA